MVIASGRYFLPVETSIEVAGSVPLICLARASAMAIKAKYITPVLMAEQLPGYFAGLQRCDQVRDRIALPHVSVRLCHWTLV
jgi:hypothetical protein